MNQVESAALNLNDPSVNHFKTTTGNIIAVSSEAFPVIVDKTVHFMGMDEQLTCCQRIFRIEGFG